MTVGLRHPPVDVVIIGAGVVGAACAYFATLAGLSVLVVDRGSVAAGTTSAGEGNLLVSDKEAGPELDLALYSHRIWHGDLGEHADRWELESKGGLVVASTAIGAAALQTVTGRQRQAGIEVTDVVADDLATLEPQLRPGLAAGAYYPQDSQVQPMLAAAHLLRLARDRGARFSPHTTVTGFVRRGDRVVGVETSAGVIDAPRIVNAAGTWAGEVAALAHVDVPILPRRGFILVTEPLPVTIRHKVYEAEYLADVASSDAGLQTSTVIEGTRSGTVLIGSSRERVGYDPVVSLPVLSRLAAKAVALFPVLVDVRAIRSYLGFRPYCPDHLPVIGPDPRAPGLWHACGHEGAGIGLSVGTGKLMAQSLVEQPTDLDLTTFDPARFPTRSPGAMLSVGAL